MASVRKPKDQKPDQDVAHPARPVPLRPSIKEVSDKLDRRFPKVLAKLAE